MNVRRTSAGVFSHSQTGRIAIAAAILLAVTAPLRVFASAKADASPIVNQTSFRLFWKQFSSAMRRGDAVAAQVMTQLPFILDGQWVTEKDYSRLWNDLLDRPTRRCLAKAPTIAYDVQLVAYCSGNMFIFTQTLDGWRFTEIGVDD